MNLSTCFRRQLSDPSSFEEPLLDSTVTVVLAASKGDSSPRVVSIDQSGELVGAGLDECIELATQRFDKLRQLVLST